MKLNDFYKNEGWKEIKDLTPTILIPITKYEELLIIKGKYEAENEELKTLLDALIEKVSTGKITPNQARIILGFDPMNKESE